jgi:hypothetical protein
MNENMYKQLIGEKGKRKLCAKHPVSTWKEGYKRCYWGFKLNQDCEELIEKGGEKQARFSDNRSLPENLKDI